ncbi:MAG: alpha/beta hydrolase [Myxococcota bacterium]
MEVHLGETLAGLPLRAVGRFDVFEGGDGPPVLLLHGFPDTPHGWRDLAPALLDGGHRVIAPYLRGYGPTAPVPGRDTTVADLVEDAVALLDALGVPEALVVGHDWGAATATALAAQHPERVRRLVTVAIPHPATIRPSLRLAWAARHFLTLRLPGAASRLRARGFARLGRLVHRWSPDWRYADDELAPVVACFSDPARLDAALGYYRGVRRDALLALLRPPIRAPTLAVAGRDDPALSVDAYDRAAHRYTGGYEVLALPGGHFVHRESAPAFAEAVLAFLRAGDEVVEREHRV